MDKVKLPKEVSEAIEYYRSCGYMNRAILDVLEDPTASISGIELKEFAKASDDGFDTLLQALVNGYEVEQTPEEKVKEYYDELRREHSQWTSLQTSIISPFAHESTGCVRTLNLLNIKIEGVNE